MTESSAGPVTAINVAGYPLIAPPAAGTKTAGEPSFSVLISAHNCADTVAESLDSVLGQSMAPFEVIVCDDGSSDSTASVLEQFRPDIVVLRQDQRGTAAARNSCLAMATATHVVPFDADDILLPACLEAYDAALRARPDLTIVTCDAYLESSGQLFDRYYRRMARFAPDDQRAAALHGHFIFGHAAIEREAAVRLGGWDERSRWGEDTDFFLRLILEGAAAGLVAEPLAIYRLRPDSQSSDRARGLRRMVEIVESALHHPSLSDAERSTVNADLEVKRRLAMLAELDVALETNAAEARRCAITIARSEQRGFSTQARVKVLLTAALPRTTRRAQQLHERRAGITPLARRVRNI